MLNDSHTPHVSNRKVQTRRSQVVCEAIEPRRLLAAGYFHNLAELVAKPNGSPLAAVRETLKSLGATQQPIPLVSLPISQFTALSNDVESVRAKVYAALDGTNPNDLAIPIVQQALFNVLQPFLLDKNGAGGVTKEDIYVTPVGQTGIDINMDLGASATFDSAVGLGFDAVPFQPAPSTNAHVSAGLKYTNLHVGFQANGTPYFNTAAADELNFSIDGFLPAAPFKLGLGFLQFSAGDATPGTRDLHLDLTSDVTTSGGLSNARLNGSANIHLNLEGIVTKPNGDPIDGIPKFKTGFDLDWPIPTVTLIAGAGRPGGGSGDDNGGFGLPTLTFQSVKVDLGSVLGSVLTPIASRVHDILAPLQPILDTLEYEIPGINDVSQAIDGPRVTLLSMVSALGAAGGVNIPPGVQEAIHVASELAEIAERIVQFTDQSDGVYLDLGTFNITGSNGADLLAAPSARSRGFGDAADSTWSALSASNLANGTTFDQLKQQILSGDPLRQGAQINQIWDELADSAVQGSVHFDVPVITSPAATALGLLLGQDVDLVTLTASLGLNVNADIPLSPFPFIIFDIKGNAHANAYAKVGYDTYGIRQAIAPTLRTVNPGLFDFNALLKGLYIDPATGLSISGGIEFDAGIGISGGPGIYFGGGLEANAAATISNPYGKDKVRPFDGDLGDGLFQASGSLVGSADVHLQIGVDTPLGFIGYQDSWEVARTTLFEFKVGPNGKTPVPDSIQPTEQVPVQLAAYDVATRTLTLAMGPNAGLLGGLGDAYASNFSVRRLRFRVQGLQLSTKTIIVTAFGLEQRFANVDRVVAVGGDGDDTLTVDDDSVNPIFYDVRGGQGNDMIRVDGAVNASLRGQAGNDTIYGGRGDDTLLLDGGTGDNTFVLGDGTIDSLNPAEITIVPGDHARLVLADDYNDYGRYFYFVNYAADNLTRIGMFVADGPDVGQERDLDLRDPAHLDLTINCGRGNDQFIGDVPDRAQLHGGSGDDRLEPAFPGSGLLPTNYAHYSFDGGAGNDVVYVDDQFDNAFANVTMAYGNIAWNDGDTSVQTANAEQTVVYSGNGATAVVKGWVGPLTLHARAVSLYADRIGVQDGVIDASDAAIVNLLDYNDAVLAGDVGLTPGNVTLGSINYSSPAKLTAAISDSAVLNFRGNRLSVDPTHFADVAPRTIYYYQDVPTGNFNLYANAAADPEGHLYLAEDNYFQLDNLRVQTVPLANATPLTVNVTAGPGDDGFAVQGLARGVRFYAYGNGGNDTMAIGGGQLAFSDILAGTVYFFGGIGDDHLTVDDSLRDQNAVYTFGGRSIGSGAGGVVNVPQNDVERVDFLASVAGPYGDSFIINGNALPNLAITGSPYDDTFRLTTFSNYGTSITIDGGGENNGDEMYLDNAVQPLAIFNQPVIYADRVDMTPHGTHAGVFYSGMESIEYDGAASIPGSGASPYNVVFVAGSPAGVPVSLNGAPNAIDLFYVGTPDGVTGTLDDVAGPVDVYLPPDSDGLDDRLTISDAASAADHVYTTAAHAVLRDGVAVVSFGFVPRTVSIVGGAGNDTMNLESGTNWNKLDVNGGAGVNVINVGHGDVSGIARTLAFSGQDGYDVVEYNDASLTGFDETFVVNAAGFTHYHRQVISFNPGFGETINTVSTNFRGRIDIYGSDPLTTAYRVDGTSPTSGYVLYGESIQLGVSAGRTDGIRSDIEFVGTGPNNVASVNDSNDTRDVVVHLDGYRLGAITGDNLFGTGGSFYPVNATTLSISLGLGSDRAYVAPLAPTGVSISGNGSRAGTPGDAIGFAFAAVHNPVLTNGGLGIQSYHFDDAGTLTWYGFEQNLGIDNAPPEATGATYDDATGIAVTFGEDVGNSVRAGVFILTNLDTGVELSDGNLEVTYDAATFTAHVRYVGGETDGFPSGTYRLSLGAAVVTDGFGNYNQSAFDFDFAVTQAPPPIPGDVDGDGVVGFTDLLAVAQHYGQPGALADGDVNGDGAVDFNDLLILAQHYGEGSQLRR